MVHLKMDCANIIVYATVIHILLHGGEGWEVQAFSRTSKNREWRVILKP